MLTVRKCLRFFRVVSETLENRQPLVSCKRNDEADGDCISLYFLSQKWIHSRMEWIAIYWTS